MSQHPENFSAPGQNPDPPGNVSTLVDSNSYRSLSAQCSSALPTWLESACTQARGCCLVMVYKVQQKRFTVVLCVQEHEMKPKPDYGADSYKGSGKLKGKVQHHLCATEHSIVPALHGMLCLLKSLCLPALRYADSASRRLSHCLPLQIALVTGADSGIGRAIAFAFAKEGANVAISYWKEDKDAEETKAAIEKAGQEAILLPGDLTQEAQCK